MALVVLLCLLGLSLNPAVGLSCGKFEDVYKNGTDIADNLWPGAFRYVPVDDPEYDFAYDMWWFTKGNPNDLVTQKRLTHPTYSQGMINDTSECHLGDYDGNGHHDTPQTQGNDFTECHPWKTESCCKSKSVDNSAFKYVYGPEWAWDNCGALTPECERFFVQEGCLYECDLHAGLFRKYHPEKGNCDDSKSPETCHDDVWMIEKMPIKGDYFDAMFDACKGNPICSLGLYQCAEEYALPTMSPTRAPQETTSAAPQETTSAAPQETTSAAAIMGFIILGLVLLGSLLCLCRIIKRERAGDPIFAPMAPTAEKPRTVEHNLHQSSSFETEANVAQA